MRQIWNNCTVSVFRQSETARFSRCVQSLCAQALLVIMQASKYQFYKVTLTPTNILKKKKKKHGRCVMIYRSKFAAHFHTKTLLVFLKLKSFHTKHFIHFFLLPVDITAAVAPDKLIPSLSICVVPLSPSGEERGEGGAGISCSGKTFFCFEKKTKSKYLMFFK